MNREIAVGTAGNQAMLDFGGRGLEGVREDGAHSGGISRASATGSSCNAGPGGPAARMSRNWRAIGSGEATRKSYQQVRAAAC